MQGLLSLSRTDLKIKLATGTETEKKHAKSLIAITDHHHLLLVTLLLLNATAMEMLPVALDKVVSRAGAIIISVTLVLLMGEILPASVMTGPKQMAIVTFLLPFVYLIMIVFFPIAWPVSKILDVVLGHEEAGAYNRIELATMVRLQHDIAVKERLRMEQLPQSAVSVDVKNPLHNVSYTALAKNDVESPPTRTGVILSPSMQRHCSANDDAATTNPMHSTDLEIAMIDGVLRFRDYLVRQVMTVDLFMISIDDCFSDEVLE
jgi:metal transporter CNNM